MSNGNGKGTWAWTGKGQQVFIPEVQLRHINPSYTTQVLRGSAHTLAVFNNEKVCIGWILKEDIEKCSSKLCNPRTYKQ